MPSSLKLLSIKSLPRAIVHFDGDSFFASVEQQLNCALRGKPVVTGGERGAATSMSYEAKVLGIKRSMTLKEIKEICPEVVIVPSDYTAYSIYAKRMYAIVRRFTPDVEEYSIDECFADITGLRRHYRMPYEDIALLIKHALESELGVTFGVGLGPNKVLAKAASKYRKPSGFTAIYGKNIHEFLSTIPIGDVWGIGRSTTHYFQKLGMRTAYDFASQEESWLDSWKLSKPFKELWMELRGKYVKELCTDTVLTIGSIIKSRTFTPASKDREFVFSQLSKNIEAACAKARRYSVVAKEITFYVKTSEFTYKSFELVLPIVTTNAMSIVGLVKKHFDAVFVPGTYYRATGIALRGLTVEQKITHDLFGEIQACAENTLFQHTMDSINKKYGRETIFLGSSMKAVRSVDIKRKDVTVRKKLVLTGDMRKKTLNIPFLGITR